MVCIQILVLTYNVDEQIEINGNTRLYIGYNN